MASQLSPGVVPGMVAAAPIPIGMRQLVVLPAGALASVDVSSMTVIVITIPASGATACESASTLHIGQKSDKEGSSKQHHTSVYVRHMLNDAGPG